MPVLRCCLLTASTCVLVATAYGQGGPPLLLREPALSASEICFSFAGDLWTVPRAGGTAHRLTASPGTESGCHYSPDGRWIAYTNTSNNNADVYVIAAGGGTPKRLTYRPSADRVRGWTADGKVLFMSDRDGIALAQALGAPRLFVQAPDGVQPAAGGPAQRMGRRLQRRRQAAGLPAVSSGQPGLEALSRRAHDADLDRVAGAMPRWRRSRVRARPTNTPCGWATRFSS